MLLALSLASFSLGDDTALLVFDDTDLATISVRTDDGEIDLDEIVDAAAKVGVDLATADFTVATDPEVAAAALADLQAAKKTRTHQPVVVTVQLDKSFPTLVSSCVTVGGVTACS